MANLYAAAELIRQTAIKMLPRSLTSVDGLDAHLAPQVNLKKVTQPGSPYAKRRGISSGIVLTLTSEFWAPGSMCTNDSYLVALV